MVIPARVPWSIRFIWTTFGQPPEAIPAQPIAEPTDHGAWRPVKNQAFLNFFSCFSREAEVAFRMMVRSRQITALLVGVIAVAHVGSTHALCPACPADWNCDGEVNGNDISDYLNAWYADLVSETTFADFNSDGETNGNDISDYTNAWYGAIVDGGFCDSAPSLTLSPTSGGLGTVVTLTLSSITPQQHFDANTSVRWIGRYVPTVGQASGVFTISFNPASVLEISDTTARVVVGTGSVINPPSYANFGPGMMFGTTEVIFGSGSVLSTSYSFVPNTNAGRWRRVVYGADGPGGVVAPTYSSVLTSVRQYSLAGLPDASAPTAEQLSAASDLHYIVEITATRNPDSDVAAPSQVALTLASFDAAGGEIDRVAGVMLTRNISASSSTTIIYRSSPATPIILLDSRISPPTVQGFYLLFTTQNGSVAVLPPSE